MSPAKRQDTVATPGEPETLPPEITRLQSALGAHLVQGKPFAGYGGKDVIASVAANEPHNIEINDPKQWGRAPHQLMGHELIHLWRNQLPGAIRSKALPVDPNKPYDLSNIEKMRTQGHTLATIPEEQAARIVQTWIADPSQRAKLDVWMNDLRTIPLSVMDPTSPGDKGINTHPRVPSPPAEAYANPTELLAEARKMKR